MKGGKRIGAGRKRGFAAKNAEEARKFLAERVAREIGPISDVLVAKAKEGDIRAIHELLDRAWGRSAQELRVTAQIENNVPSEKIEAMGVVADELMRLTLDGMTLPDALARFRQWHETTNKNL